MHDTVKPPSGMVRIGNAGLVLAHPFLPMLFGRLDLLVSSDEGAPQLRGEQRARAVHLLQYLVDGRSDAPDAQLVLNKLLCGLEADFPAPPVVLRQEEQLLCDQLLTAIIEHWHSIGKTSITGLRETFLQREGRLQWDDGQCTLTLQRAAFDVLLDRLPWSIAVIRQPWMRQALQVSR